VSRVGVDLLFVRPGRVGGSEEYSVRGLLGLLAQGADDLDLTLFVLQGFAEAHPELCAQVAVEVLPSSGRRRPLRVAAQNTWLAAKTRVRRLDVVHFAGGTMPVVRPAPGVLTIHDLQPLEMPNNFSVLKRSYIRTAVPRSARAARLVLTPSETARQSVIELLEVPAERVRVVPHGIEPAPAGGLDPDAEATLRERYGLQVPFFLYPAITYPHKNHSVLVRALGEMARTDALLVLTGGEGPSEGALRDEIAQAGLQDRVRRTGRISRPDLDGLYRLAAAVCFPSRYEGFGSPVLEAMNLGCPVIAAERTALIEVVAGAGVLLDPFDDARWAAAMDEVLDDNARREALVATGLARAAEYTWERSGAALAEAYRSAAAPAGGAAA
jgi:alpha-1,3-rhamnosyl/mannosyltransferase